MGHGSVANRGIAPGGLRCRGKAAAPKVPTATSTMSASVPTSTPVQIHLEAEALRTTESPLLQQGHEAEPAPVQEALSAKPCCRICLQEDEVSNLLAPCGCKGSMALVHERCLQGWRRQRLYSQRCELCGVRYKMWGGLSWMVLLLAQAAWFSMAVLLAHTLLVTNGLRPPARSCCGYTRAWKRGLGQLFAAGDKNSNGRLSAVEMQAMANATGEPNVTVEMLTALIDHLGPDSSGIVEEGLAKTYWISDNDKQLLVDLEVYGLSGTLDYRHGDVETVWVLAAVVLLAWGVKDAWPSLPGLRSKSWILAIVIAIVLQPWRCRILACLVPLIGLAVWLVAYAIDEDERSAGTNSASRSGRDGRRDDDDDEALWRVMRTLVCVELAGVAMLLEARAGTRDL